MDINEYQTLAEETAIYPAQYTVFYPAIGLAGEAGEILNKLKKTWRDGTDIDEDALFKELGDCLWYIAAIATDMDWDLNSVASENLRKLQTRKAKGTLGGSGDNR